MSNITIKEIAKLAGVSSATVSRVLNNNGRFSEETRQKVLEIARKFDYRTNVVAKSLRTSRSKTIGVIVPDITNEFFANIVLAIEHYCVPNGYSIFICNTSENEEKEKMYLRDLEAKGVDGLIFISGNMELYEDLIKRNLPIVCIDRRPENKDVVVIESDNYTGGFIATEELIRCGCREIVILKDKRQTLSPMQSRYKGYQDALIKHGIKLDLRLVRNINISVDDATRAVFELIEEKIPFDGIFATTDWIAIGALIALETHKIRVPDDVKIVGFDNISIAAFSFPPVTSVNQDKWKLGKTAARVLLDMINNKKPRNRKIVIPVELVRRRTTTAN